MSDQHNTQTQALTPDTTPHHTTQVHTKIGPGKRGLTIAQGRHARRILSPARHPGLDSPRPPGHLCTDPAVSLKYLMITDDHHRAVPSPAGADWCLGRDAGDCGSAALVLGKTSCKMGSRSAPEGRASQPLPPLGAFNPKMNLDNPGGGELWPWDRDRQAYDSSHKRDVETEATPACQSAHLSGPPCPLRLRPQHKAKSPQTPRKETMRRGQKHPVLFCARMRGR